MPCCQCSFSVYPVQVITQVFCLSGIFPNTDHNYPIKWGRIIIHLFIVSKKVFIHTPISSVWDCLYHFGVWEVFRHLWRQESKHWIWVSGCHTILRKFWAGQPKFLGGWIPRQVGMGWYDMSGGQLELSVNSASQRQVLLKETWGAQHPFPTHGHLTSPDQLWV